MNQKIQDFLLILDKLNVTHIEFNATVMDGGVLRCQCKRNLSFSFSRKGCDIVPCYNTLSAFWLEMLTALQKLNESVDESKINEFYKQIYAYWKEREDARG